jgi:hypothetical protein
MAKYFFENTLDPGLPGPKRRFRAPLWYRSDTLALLTGAGVSPRTYRHCTRDTPAWVGASYAQSREPNAPHLSTQAIPSQPAAPTDAPKEKARTGEGAGQHH